MPGDGADMLLDGLLCQECFAIIDGDEPGYPRWCETCRQAGADVAAAVILKELSDEGG